MHVLENIHCVPASLCGEYRQVRRTWGKIARVAARSGSWETALEGAEWLPIDQTDGLILLHGPDSGVKTSNMLLFTVARTVAEDVLWKVHHDDREAVYQALKRLTLEGLPQFWFCLVLLAPWGFPKKTSFEHEQRVLAYRILSGLIKYWDCFCELDHRIASNALNAEFGIAPGWPSWMLSPQYYGNLLGVPFEPGVPILSESDPVKAGETIREWLREYRPE